MPSPLQTFTALALAAFVTLVPAAAASAKKPKPAAWAKQNHLSGAWRAKDADRDGVKNLAEYKLGTKPRKADTDKDGLKDGDEWPKRGKLSALIVQSLQQNAKAKINVESKPGEGLRVTLFFARAAAAPDAQSAL